LRDVREPVGGWPTTSLAVDEPAPTSAGPASRSQADAAAALAHASSADDTQDGFHHRCRRHRQRALLGCCITFGTAHMFTRAGCGRPDAGVELLGIPSSPPAARRTLAIVGVVVDIIGAVWRV
jgi:hypothetical protein